jgi:hypothetical protein
VPLAIATGYVFHYLLKFFDKRDKLERQIIGVALLFMIFAGVACDGARNIESFNIIR